MGQSSTVSWRNSWRQVGISSALHKYNIHIFTREVCHVPFYLQQELFDLENQAAPRNKKDPSEYKRVALKLILNGQSQIFKIRIPLENCFTPYTFERETLSECEP